VNYLSTPRLCTLDVFCKQVGSGLASQDAELSRVEHGLKTFLRRRGQCITSLTCNTTPPNFYLESRDATRQPILFICMEPLQPIARPLTDPWRLAHWVTQHMRPDALVSLNLEYSNSSALALEAWGTFRDCPHLQSIVVVPHTACSDCVFALAGFPVGDTVAPDLPGFPSLKRLTLSSMALYTPVVRDTLSWTNRDLLLCSLLSRSSRLKCLTFRACGSIQENRELYLTFASVSERVVADL
jgi:hypothetical protein